MFTVHMSHFFLLKSNTSAGVRSDISLRYAIPAQSPVEFRMAVRQTTKVYRMYTTLLKQ